MTLAWYNAPPPNSPMSRTLFLDVQGLRARVSPNYDGGPGYVGCVYDGTQEGYLLAPSLGKFPTQEEAKAACIDELKVQLPEFDPASVSP